MQCWSRLVVAQLIDSRSPVPSQPQGSRSNRLIARPMRLRESALPSWDIPTCWSMTGNEKTMAEVLLYHHAQGLTAGVEDFADRLRRAGHTVHTPDLYEGRVFDNLDDGVGFASETGFDTIMHRGLAAADLFSDSVVYAGFSLGVMPAQRLAQTRPGAKGALLFHSCLPVSEFGAAWPAGVPVQIHGMDDDPYFAGEGDIDAARDLVASTDHAELFVYPGREHLFVDPSLPSYDQASATILISRVLEFLDGIRSA